MNAVSLAHQFTTYSIATPLQEAVAVALEQAQTNGYFELLRTEYFARRASLFKTLQTVGLKPKLPSGSFFIVGDIVTVSSRARSDRTRVSLNRASTWRTGTFAVG